MPFLIWGFVHGNKPFRHSQVVIVSGFIELVTFVSVVPRR